jgi:hypothetical protein
MNTIGWGQAVQNNTVGFGGVTAAIERTTTNGEVRLTEAGEVRVVENSGLESFGSIYSTTFAAETDLTHEG